MARLPRSILRDRCGWRTAGRWSTWRPSRALRITWRILRAVRGSRPAVGSSKNRSPGRCRSARANVRRPRMPFENSPTSLSASCSSPTRSRRAPGFSVPPPCNPAKSCRFSRSGCNVEERQFKRSPSPRILNAAERSKGAARFRCRQLDGRAAILMVVARPGGCELAGSVCRSCACWPFTCLETIPPVVVTGRPEHVSRGLANLALAARPRNHSAGFCRSVPR